MIFVDPIKKDGVDFVAEEVREVKVED